MDILHNISNYKCRLDVPNITTLLEKDEEMWYICREPKDLIENYYNRMGEKLKTIEGSQYIITYFNYEDK